MKTTVLRKMSYQGTFIYVLNQAFSFTYLFAWNNEVYRQEIFMKPNWYSWRLWAWRLGRLSDPYTRYEREQGELVVLSGAMKSIDLLLQDKSGSKRRRAEKVAKRKARSGDCQWQARANMDGLPMLLCLTHNETVPIGDNPKHI